jgi:diguanylate cyclase (GGDEF)-like protein/PAS domain S-box-containing protein
MKTTHSKELLFAVIFFSILAIALHAIGQYSFFSSKIKEVAFFNAFDETKVKESILSGMLSRAKISADSLRQSNSFKRFLADESTRHAFESLALQVAKSHKDIISIRFLDAKGIEKIKISRPISGSQPSVSVSKDLQNRSRSDYFQQALAQSSNTTWSFSVDLDRQNKHFQPTRDASLRMTLPINQQGVFIGILVVNYSMKTVLETLLEGRWYDIILVDIEGNILLNQLDKQSTQREAGLIGLIMDGEEFAQVKQHTTYQSERYFSRQLALPFDRKLVLILMLDDAFLTFQQQWLTPYVLYGAVVTLLMAALLGYLLFIFWHKFRTEQQAQSLHDAQVESLTQQLEKNQTHTQYYLELITNGTFVLNEQGKLEQFNSAFATMLGYSEDELTKLGVSDWDVNAAKLSVTEYLQSLSSAHEPASQYQCKDGSVIDVELHSRQVGSNDKALIYCAVENVSQRKRLEKEVESLTTIDPLTQLSTLRVFNTRITEELERFHRDSLYHTAIALIDVDQLGKVNAQHNRDIGDLVLRHVSSILGDGVRSIDLAARYDGDQFALILVGINEEQALVCLERLRNNIEKSDMDVYDQQVAVSISGGVTCIMQEDKSIETVLARADKALYHAKRLGRNRIETFGLS